MFSARERAFRPFGRLPENATWQRERIYIYILFQSGDTSALDGEIFCTSSRFSKVSRMCLCVCVSVFFRVHQFAGMMLRISEVTQTGVKFHVPFFFALYIILITIMFAALSLLMQNGTHLDYFCTYIAQLRVIHIYTIQLFAQFTNIIWNNFHFCY